MAEIYSMNKIRQWARVTGREVIQKDGKYSLKTGSRQSSFMPKQGFRRFVSNVMRKQKMMDVKPVSKPKKYLQLLSRRFRRHGTPKTV